MPAGTVAIFLAKVLELVSVGGNGQNVLGVDKTFHKEASFVTIEGDLLVDG
jgi:hypothetical protein